MMTRGSERRKTVNAQYHSSDGPRNFEAKTNLVNLKNHGSSKKLVTPVMSNKLEFQNNAFGLKNTLELAPLSSTPSASISKRSNNSIGQKADSPSKKGKLKVYVFKRKDNQAVSDSKIQSSKIVDSDSSEEQDKPNDQNKITEENNRLIEQMMMDRKRQSSYTAEMSLGLKSNLSSFKSKQKKKVIRKIIQRRKTRQFTKGQSNDFENNSLALRDTNTPDVYNDRVAALTHKARSNAVNSPNFSKGIITNENRHSSTPLSKSGFKTRDLEERRTSELPLERLSLLETPSSPMKRTTEQIIAQTMADLAKIKEENSVSEVSTSKLEDPSPKVVLDVKDTWEPSPSKLDDTCHEIMKDIEDLELKYKLRENWLDTQTSAEKPFVTEVSAIFTHNE